MAGGVLWVGLPKQGNSVGSSLTLKKEKMKQMISKSKRELEWVLKRVAGSQAPDLS